MGWVEAGTSVIRQKWYKYWQYFTFVDRFKNILVKKFELHSFVYIVLVAWTCESSSALGWEPFNQILHVCRKNRIWLISVWMLHNIIIIIICCICLLFGNMLHNQKTAEVIKKIIESQSRQNCNIMLKKEKLLMTTHMHWTKI